jgi:hypothetical protein
MTCPECRERHGRNNFEVYVRLKGMSAQPYTANKDEVAVGGHFCSFGCLCAWLRVLADKVEAAHSFVLGKGSQ